MNCINNLAASVNEDLRQLKDFKALISEKTVPKSIKILKRTVWILVMILIILTGLKKKIKCFKKNLIGVELSQKIGQGSSIREGMTAIYNAVSRESMMADVNYEVRRLDLLAK